MMYTGEPGGHQARQQEEDRADAASFDGAQTCKFFDMSKLFFVCLIVLQNLFGLKYSTTCSIYYFNIVCILMFPCFIIMFVFEF